jgi:predicted NBD/HSP70 family sugar kinase
LRGGGSLVVGVEVAGTSVTAELFDQAMARLARKRLPVLESAPDAVVEQVLAAVAAVRRQVYEAPVRAIGVSLPEHRFRALLERRCDVPVVLDQPLKAMTLAEQTFGAARDQDDVIVVDLGTGTGLGVVSGGRLLRGATNSAGEWGHAVLHAGALTDLLDGSPFLVPGDQEATVARFAEAVRQGDFTALETFNRFSRELALALADAVALLDPGLIVFGGWVGAALGEPLVAAVTPVIKEYALGTCFEATTASLGGHLDNPVSLGMAVLAFETHLHD